MAHPSARCICALTLLLCGICAHGDEGQQSRIDQAILDLASHDFVRREAASHELWSAGHAAEPALRQALRSSDPEVVFRVRGILADFSYGLLPDTPKELLTLLEQYRGGNAEARALVVQALGQQGPVGMGLLLKLQHEEEDPNQRSSLADALSGCRQAAIGLIHDGKDPAAEALLRAAASGEDGAGARDYAAFLLLRGRLDESLREAAGSVAPPAGGERLRAFLCRAKGDLNGARAAAQRSGDSALFESILMERGEWNLLAQRSAVRAEQEPSLESFSYAMGYCRLSGDAAGFSKWMAAIRDFVARQPDEAAQAAETFFLNGRSREAIELLLSHNEFSNAGEFLAVRGEFDELLGLVERAKANAPAELPKVQALAARTLGQLGEKQRAQQLLEEAAQGKADDEPFGGADVIRVARSLSLGELSDRYLLSALGDSADALPPASLFQQAGMGDGTAASMWWKLLRNRFAGEQPAQILARLRRILLRQLPPAELRALCNELIPACLASPAESRDPALEAIGSTLQAAGLADDASRCFERWSNFGLSAAPLIRVGDLRASARRWAEAADFYGRAWDKERTNPIPLALRGWALMQAGEASSGRKNMEEAHLLPLGDEAVRNDLYDALVKHGLNDEAKRERELILRTGGFLSRAIDRVNSDLGDEALARGDHTAAVRFFELAYIDNLSPGTMFVNNLANLTAPTEVRRARALAALGAGDLAGAMKHIEEAWQNLPGETNGSIELINALQKQGHPPQAEALYRRALDVQARLLARYPQSSMLNNNIAWLQANCRRDLKDAVAHAQRAVEGAPDNVAILDTLAEAYYQSGDRANAIATMRKCVALQPAVKRHQERLRQIETGGTTAPAVDPEVEH